MHAPRPFGRFVEDAELSPEDAAAVAALARRLSNFKQAGALDGLRWRRVLPSGRVAVLRDMGGVFKVVVLEPQRQPGAHGYRADAAEVPMLFSGLPLRWVLRPGQAARIGLTRMCRRRLHGYDGSMAPEELELQRFVIPYGPRFVDLAPAQAPQGLLYTQYHGQHPSWYSGAMQTVVQCVAGYGRQVVPQADVRSPYFRYETARMELPGEVARQVAREVGDWVLPGFAGRAADDGAIAYGFQADETHAVAFAEDGRPWLVRVAGGWVDAMPLPLIAATTTAAFRQYVQSVADDEILALLDLFGGMPSGEGFPQGQALQAWMDAGVVVRVCRAADYASHWPLSSACGWAFADHGRQGYNTALSVSWVDEAQGKGMMLAHAYKLSLRIGPTVFDGRFPQALAQLDAQANGALSRYMGRVLAQIPEPAQRDAVRFKMYATGAEQMRGYLGRVDSVESQAVYWLNKKAAAIAQVNGNVAKVGQGPYWPGHNFKLPEPTADGCIDVQPLIERKNLAGYPKRWDTIVFGYYSGNELKVVKQHSDANRPFYTAQRSDFEPCMIVGSWTKVSEVAASRVKGTLSSTDFDLREVLPDSDVTTTRRVGRDLGYDDPPRILYPYPLWSSLVEGGLFRHRYYSIHLTEVSERGGTELALGGCVPFLSRNALLFAHAKWRTGETVVDESLQWSWVVDPNRYTLRRPREYHPRLPSVTYLVGRQDVAKGPCSDFADQGDWGPGVGEVTSYERSILAGPTARHGWSLGSETGPYGGGSDPKVRTFERRTVTRPGRPYVGDVEWEQRHIQRVVFGRSVERYFLPSPSPGEQGASFRQDATRNCAGLSYEVTSESDGRRGHSRFHGRRAMPFFIGVVNE